MVTPKNPVYLTEPDFAFWENWDFLSFFFFYFANCVKLIVYWPENQLSLADNF